MFIFEINPTQIGEITKLSILNGDTLTLSDHTPKAASKTTVYAPPKSVNPLDPTVKTANIARQC